MPGGIACLHKAIYRTKTDSCFYELLFYISLQVTRHSPMNVIAVKPDVVRTVLEDIRHELNESHLLVSIAAGVPNSFIQSVCVFFLEVIV